MRLLFSASLTAALLTLALPAAAQLDPKDPEDAVKMTRKIQCSLADGEPAFYSWKGRAYVRMPGRRDRHVFDVLGMNVRQCGTVASDERGYGYRQVSREVMLYLDPQTGAVLDRWENPFTGETVDVVHVQNDPVNMRAPMHAIGRDGAPYVFAGSIGEHFVLWTIEVPLFYTNPLGGAYQDYVGNHYQAMEIFDFTVDKADLLNAGTDSADKTAVAWVRLAQYLPWMRMGSLPGSMIINAAGTKVQSFADLPETLRQQIEADYPAYKAPPPLDDTRPNETSWTVFKNKIDAERGKAGPDG